MSRCDWHARATKLWPPAETPTRFPRSAPCPASRWRGLNSAIRRAGSRRSPTDYYGATKASTEMFARAFARTAKVQVHVIRPGYIFAEPVVEGASVYSDKRFRNICRAVREGQPVHLIQNDGTQFLHASNIAKVYEALLTHEVGFSTHFALAKDWCSWADIARMAMAEHGREA